MYKKLDAFKAPHRYIFEDPDTGFKYESNSKEDLVKRIINYRTQNNLLPIEHLHLVLENYWCELPENAGKCKEFKLQRGWFPTLKGAVQVLKNVFFGDDNLCSVEKAEERAGICASCPENVFPDKTYFVKWSDELAEASTGGRKTSKDRELGSCKVCTCTLKAIVHAKNMYVEDEVERSKYPLHCWKINKDG